MILLPDEDDKPVTAQVYSVIGEALRQSVANAEPGQGFASRLAAALDAAEVEGLDGAPASAAAAGGEAGDARERAPDGVSKVAGQAATGETGQGSAATETAS